MNLPALLLRHPFPAAAVLPRFRALTSSASTYIDVDIDATHAVAVVEMTRHSKMNALSRHMALALSRAVVRLDDDASVRAIVLTGGARAFCTGADIDGLHAAPAPSDSDAGEDGGGDGDGDGDGGDDSDGGGDWMERIARVQTPIVAAVEGFALGPGCGLALVSDVVIAGEQAMFGVPDVLLGRIPSFDITQRLPRAVGRAKAMEMALTGRQMNADEAESAGLVSRVAKKGGAMEEAVNVARVIASYSSPVVRSAKRCVAFGSEARLGEGGPALEKREWQKITLLRDYEEGIKAFKSEREPKWKHR